MTRLCERCGMPARQLLFHLCPRCLPVVDRIYDARGRNRVEVTP